MTLAKYLTGVILALALLASCAGSPDRTPSPEVEGLTTEEGETVRKKVTVWRVLHESILYSDGSVDKRVAYEYDAVGNLLTVVEENSRGEVVYERRYNWDSGRPVTMTMFDASGLISTTRYVVDSQGRTIKESKEDSNGSILSMMEYDYKGNNLIKSIASDGSGVPQLIFDYEYEEGSLVVVEYRRPDGRMESRFERTMDGDRILDERTVLPDGTVETSKSLEYDGDNLISETYFFGRRKTKSVRFETDGNGNIVREAWTNRAGRNYEIVERRWMAFEVDGER